MSDTLSARDMVMVLVHTLAEAGAATQRVGGTIGFFLRGDHGASWVVDMDAPGGRWLEFPSETPPPEVGTAILSTELAFPDLFLLPATIPTLVAVGDVEIRGDTDRLRRLAHMLSTGGSLLDLRARGSQA